VSWMFVCCHVEVFATSWSLVQRSPTDCGASLCVIKKPRERGHSPHWAAVPDKIIITMDLFCSVVSLLRIKLCTINAVALSSDCYIYVTSLTTMRFAFGLLDRVMWRQWSTGGAGGSVIALWVSKAISSRESVRRVKAACCLLPLTWKSVRKQSKMPVTTPKSK
jgi:hypothetical protein